MPTTGTRCSHSKVARNRHHANLAGKTTLSEEEIEGREEEDGQAKRPPEHCIEVPVARRPVHFIIVAWLTHDGSNRLAVISAVSKTALPPTLRIADLIPATQRANQ